MTVRPGPLQPWVLFGGLGVLCAIAVPALGMRIGVPDDGNAPAHTTQRIAYDQLADGFGPGFNGPILVVVELSALDDAATVGRIHDAVQADPGIAAVTAPVLNAAGDTAVFTANPTTAPQAEATDQLVRHLRTEVLPVLSEVAGIDASRAELMAQRARRERALAERAERENRLQAGELLRKAEVVRVNQAASLTVRDNLLAVPDGAAEEIYGAAERGGVIGVAKALRTAIEEALTAAAEADVELEPDEAPDDGEAAV